MQPYWNGQSWVYPQQGMMGGGGLNSGNDDIMAALYSKLILDGDVAIRNAGVKARLDWVGSFLDGFNTAWTTFSATPIVQAITGTYASQKFE